MKKTQLGFTFVELIIVVVILGILGTIGFVSYSGYLGGVRDGNRIAQIKDIQKTLQVYSTNKSLPLPDDSVEITASGATVGYQGYAGKNVLQQIQYTNGGVDPQDNTYFTYMISKNKKQFQVLTFLEESDNLTKEPTTYLPGITQTYAADLSERYPKSLGAQLGVILQDTTNTPIQDIESGSVDIVTSGDDYHAVLSDTETLSGSGALFTSLINNASCKRIQQLGKSKGSTTYNINPTGGDSIEVYCDMETDGGGWTLVAKAANDNVSIFGHLNGSAWSNSPTYTNLLFDGNEFGVNNGWEIPFKYLKLCRDGVQKCMNVDIGKSIITEACSSGSQCTKVNATSLTLYDIFTQGISVWMFENDTSRFQQVASELGVGSFNHSNTNGCGINIGQVGSRRVRVGCGGDASSNHHYDDSSVGIGVSGCGNGGCVGTTIPNYSTYLYNIGASGDGPDTEINYIFIR